MKPLSIRVILLLACTVLCASGQFLVCSPDGIILGGNLHGGFGDNLEPVP